MVRRAGRELVHDTAMTFVSPQAQIISTTNFQVTNIHDSSYLYGSPREESKEICGIAAFAHPTLATGYSRGMIELQGVDTMKDHQVGMWGGRREYMWMSM